MTDDKVRYRSSEMRRPIPFYCDDCEKIVNGLCSAWADVCARVGANRGGYIGCPFSPMEVIESKSVRKRIGQQKQKKGIIKS